ncbi:MAG: HD domain-containing protein [Candidatus Eisenbacteria bacterium]
MSDFEPKPSRPEEAETTQRLGRDVARALIHALRTVRTHGPQNQVSTAAVTALVQAFNRALQHEGSFALATRDHALWLGDARLVPPPLEQRAVDLCRTELAGRGIEALRMSNAVTPAEVWHLLRVLSRVEPNDPGNFSRLKAELDLGHTGFSLTPLLRTTRSEPVTPGEETAAGNLSFRFDWSEGADAPVMEEQAERGARRDLVRHLQWVVDEARLAARSGDPWTLRTAKRAAMALVDEIDRDAAALLGAAAVGVEASPAARHAIHVAIYAVALARAARIPRVRAIEVALAALLHDVGEATQGEASVGESAPLSDHPRRGAREAQRFFGASPLGRTIALAVLEHHEPYQRNGDRPQAGATSIEPPPHLYARILAIADAYERLATGALAGHGRITRQEALALLHSQASRAFDPVLLKCFVTLLGFYPVGSSVRLLSGRLGVVVKAPRDPRLCHRPVLALLNEAHGATAEPRREIDLSDAAEEDEIVAITACDDPEELRRIFA